MSELMSPQSAKERAKERDGYKCRFCGMNNEEHKSEYGTGVHAHHIVKDADEGADKPENLITVCRDCHNTLEKTQADALSRIRDEHTERLQAKLERKEREIEDLESALAHEKFDDSRVWGTIERVHELERQIRDTESIAHAIEGETIRFHLVSAIMGAKADATAERQQAADWYDEWGDKMARKIVRIDESDAERLAEYLADYLVNGSNLPAKVAEELR